MSMTTEAVEALHEATAALKDVHSARDTWMRDSDEKASRQGINGDMVLMVTKAEAEAIFAQRIAAHEARITDLGWKRVIVAKGETVAAVEKAREESIAQPERNTA